MFDTVKTLVVVDITAHFCETTIRMCHGNYQGPVFDQSEKWARWWVHAKRAVFDNLPSQDPVSSIHD